MDRANPMEFQQRPEKIDASGAFERKMSALVILGKRLDDEIDGKNYRPRAFEEINSLSSL